MSGLCQLVIASSSRLRKPTESRLLRLSVGAFALMSANLCASSGASSSSLVTETLVVFPPSFSQSLKGLQSEISERERERERESFTLPSFRAQRRAPLFTLKLNSTNGVRRKQADGG